MVRAELATFFLSLALPAISAALTLTPVDLSALGNAAQPSVAADPRHGGYVLSWQARLADGCAALRAAELSADGQLGPVREIERGCNWFVNWADFPSLVVADNGDWLSFWLQKTGSGTYAYEIRTRRSSDRGRSWSAPLVPHRDGSETEHGFVSMAPAGADRVLLLWLDGREMAEDHADHEHDHGGGRMTLRSAILRRGNRIEAEALVDDNVCSCCTTDLARRADGQHLALYRNRTDAEIRDIGVARRDSAGWRQDGLVHADGWHTAACPVNGPALAVGAAGELAVWPTMPDATQLVLKARRLDGDAAPQLIEAGTGVVGRVDAAAFGAGGWLLSWLGAGSGSGATLRLAHWDADLQEQSRLAVAELPPGRDVGMPRLASRGEDAVLVWTEITGPATPPAKPAAQLRAVLVRIAPGSKGEG